MMKEIFFVNLYKNSNNCNNTERCKTYINKFEKRMVGRMVKTPKMEMKTPPVALINLDEYENYNSFVAAARKIHKANAVRKSSKSEKLGYSTGLFAWRNYIPDIFEINTSMKVRSGGNMKAAYNRSIEELGGEPDKKRPVNKIKCEKHHTWAWGCFIDKPGHRQGCLTLDKQLVAYIKVKRQGNLLIYTSILGHGKHLGAGVMFKLHFDIMRWIYENRDGVLSGVEFMIYSGFNDGTEGLKVWKKRCLFRKAFLEIK